MQAQLAKPAAPAVPTVGFTSLQQASSGGDLILILAKAKEGKTTCALTASEKFDPRKSGKGVVIDDIAVLSFEKTGLASAKVLGYDFKYLIDMSPFTSSPLVVMDKVLQSGLEQIQTVAKAGLIKAVVVDGITVLDTVWSAELSKQYEKWDHGRAMNAKHERFLMALTALQVNVIVTLHTKVLSQGMDADKRATLGLDPEDRVVMDISAWDGPKFYRAMASVTIPLKRVAGKTYKEDQYFLYPRGVDGIEAGSRYSHLSAFDKIPANMQELYKHISGASSGI